MTLERKCQVSERILQRTDLSYSHRAGYFEFDIDAILTGVEPADAPVRLKVVFGEVLNDVAESFDDYK